MRAEGLTGRGVIDRFLMIDRFYWHSRESTNKSFFENLRHVGGSPLLWRLCVCIIIHRYKGFK